MRNLVFRGAQIPLGFDLGPGAGQTWVCTLCGEAWGKLEGSPGYGWIVSGQRCDLHPSRYETGGSFLRRIVWENYQTPQNPGKTLDKCSELFLRHEALMKSNQLLAP